MRRVASFDIFDTCLVRKCGQSRYLYDVLSKSVFSEPVDESVRQDFVSSRIAAGYKSGTIDGIYASLGFEHPRLYPSDVLICKEIACEKEMLVPVISVKEIIRKKREEGYQIAFISDMYLPTNFILSVLKKYELFADGDIIYISGSYGQFKYTGDLYRLVQKEESFDYKYWEHWGDNTESDYKIPTRLGIKCHLINNDYSKEEKMWQNAISYEYPSAGIVSGLSRALRLSSEINTHLPLLADIVAPFTVAFVLRILDDANRKGINRLYFFARDTYTHYLVAKFYQHLFPRLDISFLYVSQSSLYEGDDVAKELYFKQIGLASNDGYAAMVDLCSSGHSLSYINSFLESRGYKKIRGYFYEIFCFGDNEYKLQDYWSLLNRNYAEDDISLSRLLEHRYLIEMFFTMNNLRRTKSYSIKDGLASPVFYEDSQQDVRSELKIKEKDKWVAEHNRFILEYAKGIESVGLQCHSDLLITEIVLPALNRFFSKPRKEFLIALDGVEAYNWEKGVLMPYVKKESILHLLRSRAKDTCWRRGTVNWSLPAFLIPLYNAILPMMKKIKNRLF